MITWPAFADAVRQCAARPAAALHVLGRPGGLLRVREGAVCGAWTPGTPLAAPSPDPAARPVVGGGVSARLAAADAVFVMAVGRMAGLRIDDEPPRPAGATGPDEPGFPVPALLAEVDRRIRRVVGRDGLLPPEETHVRLLGPAPGRRLLTPTADERVLLDVLAGSDSGRTVRELAFGLGRGVFAVLLDVQRLAAMGSVGLAALPPVLPRPELVVQARSTLDGPSGAAVNAAPRRRRTELADDASPAPVAPTRLVRRVPGASGSDRVRRRAPWRPRRPPHGDRRADDGQW